MPPMKSDQRSEGQCGQGGVEGEFLTDNDKGRKVDAEMLAGVENALAVADQKRDSASEGPCVTACSMPTKQEISRGLGESSTGSSTKSTSETGSDEFEDQQKDTTPKQERRPSEDSGMRIPDSLLEKIVASRTSFAAGEDTSETFRVNADEEAKVAEGEESRAKQVPEVKEGLISELQQHFPSTESSLKKSEKDVAAQCTLHGGCSYNNQEPGAFACSAELSVNNSQRSIGESSHSRASAPELTVSVNRALSDAVLETARMEEDVHDGMATATAFQLEEAQVEEEIRNRILSEAVEADAVKDDGDDHQKRCLWLSLACLLQIVVIVVVIAVVVTLLRKEEDSPSPEIRDIQPAGSSEAAEDFTAIPTIDLVRKRGVVRCGVSGDIPGFSDHNDEGVMVGMNVDHCRAISMAVFGNPEKIETVRVVPADRFYKLGNGTVDVLAITTTHTMGRDVFDGRSETRNTFSVPFFYTGLVFGGIPEYVECADNQDSLHGDCRSIKACVIAGTTHYTLLEQLLPGAIVVPAVSTETMVEDFVNGSCHILASELPTVPEVRFRNAGFTGPFAHGHKLFSREPLTLVTRQADKDWSNLVNTIVNIFYLAESKSISKDNAHEMYNLILDGDQKESDQEELAAMMEGVIAEFGNYGDLYAKNVEHILPRRGINQLYGQAERETGLLYSFPFGAVDDSGPDPEAGLTLDKIMQRGDLQCGIRTDQGSAFATFKNESWSGFDVEFCRMLSAAIFAGNPDAVVFVEVSDDNETPETLLNDGAVDVVAGARVTLQADFAGYAFSTPYFYDDKRMEARALMTLDSDGQWSDFVYWIVMAVVYAEEHGISHNTSEQMPVVNLFGQSLKQMFRDCVLAMGSYGDVYNRTLATTIPRSGGNMLNLGPAFGPQQFPFPYV